MSDSEYKDPEWDNSLELKKALKLVLKYEIHCLLRRLSETGEESVVITASAAEGSASHLCSKKGEDFLQIESLDVVKHNFLSYCKVASEPSFNKKSSLENFMSQSQTAPKEQYEVSPKEQSSEEITIIEPVSIKSEPIDIDLDLDLQASELTECPQPQEQKTVGRESSQAHRGEFYNTPHHSEFGTLPTALKSCGDRQRTEREGDYCDERQYRSFVHDTIFHPSYHNNSFAKNGTASIPPSKANVNVENSASDSFTAEYWSNVACTRGNIRGREMNNLMPDQVECFSSVDKIVTFSNDIIKEISAGLSQSDSHAALVHSSASKNQECTVPEYYTRHSHRETREAHLEKSSRNGLGRQKSKSNAESKSQTIRLYICQYCGKTFSLKGNFERHVRSHTGERPYPCNICGQGLGDKRSLFEHMQRHTGAHLYKCAHCDKSFRFHSEHIKHVRKFHKRM